jgi:hypothetical protein
MFKHEIKERADQVLAQQIAIIDSMPYLDAAIRERYMKAIETGTLIFESTMHDFFIVGNNLLLFLRISPSVTHLLFKAGNLRDEDIKMLAKIVADPNCKIKQLTFSYMRSKTIWPVIVAARNVNSNLQKLNLRGVNEKLKCLLNSHGFWLAGDERVVFYPKLLGNQMDAEKEVQVENSVSIISQTVPSRNYTIEPEPAEPVSKSKMKK